MAVIKVVGACTTAGALDGARGVANRVTLGVEEGGGTGATLAAEDGGGDSSPEEDPPA